eukprot:14820580-Alexandrium_andersonii.AAC.1
MDPFANGDHAPQALVSSWPVAQADDTCGWAVHHRMASGPRHRLGCWGSRLSMSARVALRPWARR